MTDAPGWLRELVTATSDLSAGELSRQVPPPPESARRSAVLVLFGESDGQPDLVLIERAHDLRSHAGQLAFPGGGADDGETAVQTALRESQEEIGLDPAGVEVMGELPALWLPPTNFAVTCVLAWWREESAVSVVDPLEVAAVLRVPLTQLVDPGRRVTVVHPLGYRGPGFVVDDLVLWGFTAAVVDRVLLHAGLAEPWDGSRTVPAPLPPGEEGR
ncbi:MAG: CoA pyrophosphatase [Actinomycetota bacterium]|nr:CoA pyrophosphatase [Actinomycetota bacterium]